MLAVDRDEAHARLALHNAAVYGRAERVTAVVADVRDVPLTGIDAVFIDPARRSGPGAASAAPGSSSTGPASTGLPGPATSEPPLDWCLALTRQVAAVCIKAAPGIPAELIPQGWEAEFIAEGRDLKEAVLWSPVPGDRPAGGHAGRSGQPAPRDGAGAARGRRTA